MAWGLLGLTHTGEEWRVGGGWEVDSPTLWLNQAPGQALTLPEDTGSWRWSRQASRRWAPWPGENWEESCRATSVPSLSLPSGVWLALGVGGVPVHVIT